MARFLPFNCPGFSLFFLFFCVASSSKPHTISFRFPGLYPEGLDWDPRASHFIVSSISKGLLASVSDAGVAEELIRDADYAGRAHTLGLKVDRPRNRLLAVLRGFDSSFSALAAYDLLTKNRIFLSVLHPVEQGQPAAANDVCFDHDGIAYVTDSTENLVWKVDLQGESSVLVKSPLFRSQPVLIAEGPAANCGLNGIAYLGGGNLLVGQSNTGVFYKIGIYDSHVRIVQIVGANLAGVDGITMRKDGTLVAVSTHTAWLLRSKDAWFSAHVIEELPLDLSLNTTAVAFREGKRPFVLHSYLHEALAGPGDREAFSIQELQFSKDQDDPIWLVVGLFLFLLVVFAWRFQMNHFFKEYTKKRE